MKTFSIAFVLFGVACSHAAATTSAPAVTAADVPAEKVEAPAAREAPAPVKAELPAVPGELVCRAKTAEGGTTELFADGAQGTLRLIGPSGYYVETKKLRIERVRATVVADEPDSDDLAVHAATVSTQDGKRYLRLGAYDQAWTPCE